MNVLLIVVDAFRYDAMTMVDGDGAPTRLTERLRDWICFEGYRVAAPWTFPSVTSLMTGVDAIHHKRNLNREALGYESLIRHLPLDHKSAVINNSVLQRQAGVDGDFDEYLSISDHRGAFVTARGLLAERRLDGKSFLLMVHSNIVHDYYLPTAAAEYQRYYPDRDDYFDIRFRVLAWKGVVERRDTMRRIYDACALRAHDEIEELLGSLPLDDTIVVITADHGEGFDPARARIHHGGRVHDDLVKVPCAIHLPASARPEMREQLRAAAAMPSTGAVDLLPTLIELLGGTPPSGLDGRSLVARPSETPRVVRIEDRRYLYLATRLRLNTNAKGKNMTRRNRAMNRVWRATVARQHIVQGFVDGSLKLVVTRLDAANPFMARVAKRWLTQRHNGDPVALVRGSAWYGLELFDLAHDPGESANLLRARSPEVAAAALDAAEAYLADDDRPRLADLLEPAGAHNAAAAAGARS